MNTIFPLSQLAPGERAVVRRVAAAGGMRRRLQDIGLIPGAPVRCVGRSPLGDPAAYAVCGAVIALRARDCADVAVERAPWD